MFEQRRKRFLDAMGPDAMALLLGARMLPRSGDTDYPFRQDSDFWYLTGFDHPDAVALFRTDGGPAYTLFVQPRQPEAETWTGVRPGVEGARADYGADEAHPVESFREKLSEAVRRARTLYHVLGRDADVDRRILDTLEDMRRRSRSNPEPASAIIDPRSVLHELRLRKEPAEIEILRRAMEITNEAHGRAAALAHAGNSERDLAAVLDYTFHQRGGRGPAYTSIVGGGANATVLHYVRNDQPLKDGELVLIDAGVELEGYAADITRTYPIGGRMQGAARAVYEVVLAAQLCALDACRPETTLDAIHHAALTSLAEGMRELGLVSGSVDEVLEKESHLPYYMHRTSHWLGLDVHDVGAYTRNGSPRPLEPGMLLTVEPGLYIRADAENAPAALRGIGVRIEDDVLITDAGCENLSAAIPKRPEDLEALVSRA